jgi:hypothetical protein
MIPAYKLLVIVRAANIREIAVAYFLAADNHWNFYLPVQHFL